MGVPASCLSEVFPTGPRARQQTVWVVPLAPAEVWCIATLLDCIWDSRHGVVIFVIHASVNCHHIVWFSAVLLQKFFVAIKMIPSLKRRTDKLAKSIYVISARQCGEKWNVKFLTLAFSRCAVYHGGFSLLHSFIFGVLFMTLINLFN